MIEFPTMRLLDGRVPWIGLPLLALCACADADYIGEFRQTLPAGDLSVLRLGTGPGFLDVEGADVDAITVDVTLFGPDGSDPDELLEFELSATEWDEAVLRVDVDPGPFANAYADVHVRLPRRMVVDGSDASGDGAVRDVAALALTDGSGNLEVERIAGGVTIEDGSGNLTITSVKGRIQVEDGSGDLVIQGGSEDVRIVDGAGNIQVEDIQGTVSVRDGSGDIVAVRVGDLRVLSDGSGKVIRTER